MHAKKIASKKWDVFGITLMELVAAIIIFSILAAMGSSLFYKTKMKTSVKMAAGNLRMIWGGERLYYQMKGYYYPNTTATVTDIRNINGNITTNIVPTSEWSYAITGSSSGHSYAANATLASGWWKNPITLEVIQSGSNVTCLPAGGPGCTAAGY